MKIDTFLKEKEKIEKETIERQKSFYQKLLEEEPIGSKVRVEAYFYYASLFYIAGDFRKVREILDPVLINYQSYPYTSTLITSFNLMGSACHCETEYQLSRYFYKVALEIAKTNQADTYLSHEHNNIAVSYIAQEEYDEALHSILLAEEYLPYSNQRMGLMYI